VAQIFFVPCKKLGRCTSQGHICMKNVHVVGAFGICSSRQVGCMLENFTSFGIVQHIKKVMSRKK